MKKTFTFNSFAPRRSESNVNNLENTLSGTSGSEIFFCF
jgi:hypothetical protein